MMKTEVRRCCGHFARGKLCSFPMFLRAKRRRKGFDYVEIIEQIVQCIGDARESLSQKQLHVVKEPEPEPEPEPRSLLESLEGTIQDGNCLHLLSHFGFWSKPWPNIGEEEGAGLLFI